MGAPNKEHCNEQSFCQPYTYQATAVPPTQVLQPPPAPHNPATAPAFVYLPPGVQSGHPAPAYPHFVPAAPSPTESSLRDAAKSMPGACQDSSSEEFSDCDPNDPPKAAIGVIKCLGRRISGKPWSWVWTILIWFYLPVISTALIEHIPKRNWNSAGGHVAFFLVLVILYVTECFKSGTLKFVGQKMGQETADQRIQRLRDATPAVFFHVECYQYEHSEGAQRKVVSRTHKERFRITRSVDTTAPLTFLEHGLVTKVYLKKGITFIDAAAEARFQHEYARFMDMNRMNAYQTFSTSIVIPGFERRMLCLVNGADPPWWLNSWAFALLSMMTLTFPYRLKLDMSVRKVAVRITKAVG